jgi:rhamnosyltransferase subunit B
VLADNYAPFATLLPRCSALIHHGGIGTLAQGLAAGLPQLVMPMAFDQHDNLRRLRELGVGDGLAPRQFSVARVSRMLQHLLQDPDVAASCARARRSSAGHDGLRAACDSLEAVALEYSAG